MTDQRGTRLAEVVASLSLAIDLGLGLPMEHVLRSTLLTLDLADRLGLEPSVRDASYYVSLLAWVGCTSDAHEVAELFGDDLIYRADAHEVDLKGMPMMRFLFAHLGSGQPPLRRMGTMASFMAGGPKRVEAMLLGHCELTATFAHKLGLGPAVQDALRQNFERWDGKGIPGRRRGEEVGPAMRLSQIAATAEVMHRIGGVRASVDTVRGRRGTEFDPTFVDAFSDCAAELFRRLDGRSAWDALVAAQPDPTEPLSPDELDACLEAMGEFADLKSPYTAGHSRGVSSLAADAARACGLSDPDVVLVRRAGLVADLGRVGVPNTIWEKPGSFSASEWERVRLHPYYTERALAHAPGLAVVGALAAMHHERLDGSGYPRGLRAMGLGMPARILAVADVYRAMLEPRPHRPPLSAKEAEASLREEVRAGRLDAGAVDATLSAAGHRVRRRPDAPGALTPRELEVLVLIARGLTNKETARRLSISPKTVGNHVEHIYTKIGVTSRAGATLWATRHGLLEPDGKMG